VSIDVAEGGYVTRHYSPVWAPEAVDIETPSAARMYDFYLGGSCNFAADRKLAEENKRVWPDLGAICQANRAFLHRAVYYLAEAGVTQFLDLGSGIPSNGNVHEVAQSVNPDAATIYVDADPVAYAHGQLILGDVPHTEMLHADLRAPRDILEHPLLRQHLDLTRPVAVVMNSALPFVPDEDDPAGIVAAYRDATAPGSYFVLSHATDEYKPERAERTSAIYTKASHSTTFRSRAQIAGLLDGYELLDPGLVDVINWRPDPISAPDPLGGDVTRYSMLVAIGLR
jgi:hypothetical protein